MKCWKSKRRSDAAEKRVGSDVFVKASLAALLAFALAWPGAALAEPTHYLRLRSGSELTVSVLKESPDSLVVDLGAQVLTLSRGDVADFRTLKGESGKTDASDAPTSGGLLAPSRLLGGGASGRLTLTPGAVPGAASRSRQQVLADARKSVVLVENPSGSGSGFVVDRAGIIVTNYHVIRGEKLHSLTFFVPSDGATFERKKIEDIEVQAVNPLLDLAILQVDPQKAKDKGIELLPLPISELVESPAPGSTVLAVGNPGVGGRILDQSVSEGIVSASARNFRDLLYIQTTAAVNPGNSGGPLLNGDGEIVGVVTFKAFFQEGIAFALPSRYLRDFLENRKAFAIDATGAQTGVRYLQPE